MEQVKIFAKTVEDEAVKQINEMSTCDAYNDCIVRIMPDCHAGTGCTIGTVISLKDKVVPNTVGVDIGCGMLVVAISQYDVVDLKRLDEVIRTYIPSSFNIRTTPVNSIGEWFFQAFKCKEALDINMAMCSVGTLGGGNHFIEVDEGEDGRKYLVIHTGSRNLGVRVCKYYQEKAIKYCRAKAVNFSELIAKMRAEGREKEIQSTITAIKAKTPPINPELAYLEGKDLEDYLHDMNLCQIYAQYNRQAIAEIIIQQMGWWHTQEEDDCKSHTIHNYIDVRHNILRKGSISALKGERVIIPINMRDGSLLCEGKGNIDWLYSAPHGAGRLMSRKKAKETLDLKDFEQSMEGIYTTSVSEDTIDESPMVYKPMEEIVECIKDTVKILQVIKPIYNFKAGES